MVLSKIKKLSTVVLSMGALSLSAGLVASNAHAAGDYPKQAITVVDGFAPGGSTDVLARILAEEVSQSLNQPVIINNRAGAGGMVATSHVARSAPDGYTLLLGTIGPIVVNPHLMDDLSYDPMEDLVPVISLVDVANVAVVQSSHPAQTVEELIKMARDNPREIDFGSAGIGTTAHLAGEVFQQEAEVEFTHVPYRGGAPAITGLLAGETDLIFSSIPTAVDHVNQGTLRALAVTGDMELETLPGVPPMKEAGLENYKLPSWYGIFAPKGTPAEVIELIQNEFYAALDKEEVQKKLISLGMVPNPVLAEDFSKQVNSDWDYWQGILEIADINLE